MSVIDETVAEDNEVHNGISVQQSGQAVVKFDDSLFDLIEEDLEKGLVRTRSVEINDVVDRIGIRSMERCFPYAGKFEARTRAAGLHRWYRIEYDLDVPFTKASDALSGIEGVCYVDEVRPTRPLAMFNDPLLSLQWGYFNDGSLTKKHNSGLDINVAPAWNENVGNAEVIVAVVDGGIDQVHEDLAANCIGGYNFVRHNTKVVPDDHGTHVAGTIAAINNNGVGVCGIAGGNATGERGVKLLSCQMFEDDPKDPDKSMSGSAEEAIKWAADNGAVIAQNSWGYVFDSYREAANTKIPQLLKEAIDYFIENAGMDENGNQVGPMKGGIVIFAAGNDGWDTDPIGKYEPVLSVGSVTSYGKRAEYSNYGNWVDIAAPGGSFEYDECMILSTLPGNSYGYMAGTSMACPHVSGAAALILSKYGGPGFTPDDLKSRLLEGADYNAIPSEYKIGPLLDVWGAMSDIPDQGPEPVTGLYARSGSRMIELEWEVQANGDGACPSSYKAFLSKKRGVLNSMDVSRIPNGVKVIEVDAASKKDGDAVMCRFNGLDCGVSYEVGVVAFDRKGRFSEMSEVLWLKTLDNMVPIITPKSAYDSPVELGAHDCLTLEFMVEDPENHDVSVFVNGEGKGMTYSYNENEKIIKMVLTGDGYNPGSYSVEIVAEDDLGARGTMEIQYILKENVIPVLLKEYDDVLIPDMDSSIELNLEEYFLDGDGGQLKYDVSLSDGGVLDYYIDGTELILYPLDYGSASVVIRADDSYGYSESLRFRVLVRNADEPIIVYPNPVIDDLNVRVVKEGTYQVEVFNPGGSLKERLELVVSPFEDAMMNISDYAPGNYNVKITSDIYVYERNIIKL